jgi:integrase
MPAFKLNKILVKNAKPGKHGDGAGLQLVVSNSLSRRWVFRYQMDGRSREMGIGGYPDISLKVARDIAGDCRGLAKRGVDPIDYRRDEKKRDRLAAAQQTRFKDCAEQYIESQRPGWKNAKHAAQWASTLETYAYPVFGDKPVASVDTEMVLEVLSPIWAEIPETASRVRGRIESVLDWATVKKFRAGENPARWRGHLNKILPKRSDVAPVRHHPALPYDDLPDFFEEIRNENGLAAQALQLVILTAARTGEIVGSTWPEIDLKKGVWTVPATRMKSRRPHRVPLSDEAILIIENLQDKRGNEFVFPGNRYDKPISNMAMLSLLKRMERHEITVHGFRSTFRDWAAEQTSFPREVAEAALAHVLTDKTEAAYQRGDLFEKRRKLMIAWGNFCQSEGSAKIVPIRRNRQAK